MYKNTGQLHNSKIKNKVLNEIKSNRNKQQNTLFCVCFCRFLSFFSLFYFIYKFHKVIIVGTKDIYFRSFGFCDKFVSFDSRLVFQIWWGKLITGALLGFSMLMMHWRLSVDAWSIVFVDACFSFCFISLLLVVLSEFGSTELCSFNWCFFKLPLSTKDLPQKSHLKARLFMCMRKCSRMFCFLVNFFRHVSN